MSWGCLTIALRSFQLASSLINMIEAIELPVAQRWGSDRSRRWYSWDASPQSRMYLDSLPPFSQSNPEIQPMPDSSSSATERTERPVRVSSAPTTTDPALV